MSAMDSVAGAETAIRRMVLVDGRTHQEVSEELLMLYPGMKGLSSQSVRRFCAKHDIHRTSRLEAQQLVRVVATGVCRVGPTYGRKTMKGLLASQGIRAGQRQIAAVMPYANPTYHYQRQTDTAPRLNPIPYHASYFGHKLHIDQNEKMVMYGVTHVCAVDGFSGKIVAFASMPVKNTVEIYKHICRHHHSCMYIHI